LIGAAVSIEQVRRILVATLKTLTITAALIAGATSLALAQNAPATGGQPPAAGGAAASGQTGGAGGTAAKTTHKKTAKPAKKPQTKPM
jgi:hypothetical protein